MKYLMISLLFFTCMSNSLYADDNTIKHVVISVGLGFVAENVIHDHVQSESKRIVYSTVLGTVPGLVKEITDNKFSGEDLVADVVGSFLGSLIANRINRKLMATIHKEKDTYMFGFVYWD